MKKRPPYEFILDELDSYVTDIKPMFGAYGIYHENRILMILRKKVKFDNDTGVWLAIRDEFVLEIKKEIPELRDLEMFGTSPTAWQVLSEDLVNFENVSLEICDRIKNGDMRIGRIPKSRLKKKIKSKKKS